MWQAVADAFFSDTPLNRRLEPRFVQHSQVHAVYPAPLEGLEG